MKYFKKIVGKNLYLSPICTEDAEIFTKWLNDKDVALNFGFYSLNISASGQKTSLEKMAENGHNYAIVKQENDELIGSMGLWQIDELNGNAMLTILIGEKENRGKGYGTEAVKLLVDYGFKILNLKNIMLTVNAVNEIGINCYKKCGFKEFGRRSKAAYLDGEYCDLVYMEILRNF